MIDKRVSEYNDRPGVERTVRMKGQTGSISDSVQGQYRNGEDGQNGPGLRREKTGARDLLNPLGAL